MKRIFSNLLTKKNKKLKFSLTGWLIISATVSVFSFLQQSTKTSPKGGTIEVGNIIFKKINTLIPFELIGTELALIDTTFNIDLDEITSVYLNASLVATRKKPSTTQVDKTIITFHLFKSIIKIVDGDEAYAKG